MIVSKRLLHPFLYGDLILTVKRFQGAKHLYRCARTSKYDLVVIERNKGIVLHSLVQIFLATLHSDNQDGGDYMTGKVQN